MSRIRTHTASVDLAAPPDVVYAFHRDTRNAPLISPAGARFLDIRGTFPVEVGTIVHLRVRQAPVPFAQAWRIRIAALERDQLVVDVAERSPFAAWRHEHRFAPLPNGGTRMTDHVEYRLPFGLLGRLAGLLAVDRMIENMFAERHARSRAYFATASAP